MEIKKMAELVHELAWAKGWHSHDVGEDQYVEAMCNNLHDEVAELHDAFRNNQLRDSCDKSEAMEKLGIPLLSCLEEELADIVIRAFDNAEKLGVDIEKAIVIKHEYNKSRSYRHGGKRS